MAEILAVSIDLTKIDKSKIKEVTRKDGTIAKFIDVSVFINDEQDQFGNIASIAMGQTKDEQTAKVPKVYLGNGKRVWASQKSQSEQPQDNKSDDLPF